MQRHKDVPSPANLASLNRAPRNWRLLGCLFFLPTFMIIASVSMACVFVGSASQTVAIRNRLPTLTRTPLPSLTPTSDMTSAAMIENFSPAIIPTPASQVIAGSVELPNAAIPAPISPSQVALASNEASLDTAASANVLLAATDSSEATLPDVSGASTPTATATAPETSTSTSTPTPTATLIPTATPTIAPTPTPADWSFASVGIQNKEDGTLLYGNLVNNTGAAQELIDITGVFYDAQGQLVAGQNDVYAYWPGYVIPHSGSMPFELTLEDIYNVANFDLSVEAEARSETPRQDFEFTDVSQWSDAGAYCVGGKLQNRGDALRDYLLISAILYDAQGNMAAFGDYEEFGPEKVAGDNPSSFEICIYTALQGVVRHEVQAWGQ